NGPIWYALYRSGLVTAQASAREKEALARSFFGFVPVSPDGTGYVYDRQRDDVSNARHGSARVRRLQAEIATDSPLAHLLREFRPLRVDLRFREDGVHTTVTWDRSGKE